MIDPNLPELAFALSAVRAACLLVREVQSEMVSPALTKSDRSPVTVADFASQALIGRRLAERFPNDILVAEEDSTALRSGDSDRTLSHVTAFVKRCESEATPDSVCQWIDIGASEAGDRFWTLDPIDGTKGFLRGDQYVVALALVTGGRVEVGVLGCPNLTKAFHGGFGDTGTLVFARRGEGTWATDLENPGDPGTERLTRLSVSGMVDPQGARLLRSLESGHTNVGRIGGLVSALGSRAAPLLMDSQAKYALLAAGEGELLVRVPPADRPDYREKIWDQAAGSLLLEEAGGRVSDLDGVPLDFGVGRELLRNRGILASNGGLHEVALSGLHAALGDD